MLDFLNDLLSDNPFRKKLVKRKVRFVQKMLTMAKNFMILEEIFTTQFDNPASSECHFGRPLERELHRCQDNSDRSIQGKYDRYTPPMIYNNMIYQEFVITKFRKE